MNTQKIENMEPHIRVGKNGLTDNVIEEIKLQLKKHKTIKIKFLRAAINDNKKELFNQLLEKTKTKLVKKIGFVVVITRGKNKN